MVPTKGRIVPINRLRTTGRTYVVGQESPRRSDRPAVVTSITACSGGYLVQFGSGRPVVIDDQVVEGADLGEFRSLRTHHLGSSGRHTGRGRYGAAAWYVVGERLQRSGGVLSRVERILPIPSGGYSVEFNSPGVAGSDHDVIRADLVAELRIEA